MIIFYGSTVRNPNRVESLLKQTNFLHQKKKKTHQQNHLNSHSISEKMKLTVIKDNTIHAIYRN